MTEITHYQPPTHTPTYQTQAVANLGQWAVSADAAYKVAERLVQTSFVPAAFRNKPVEATAAILAGTEVGLSPMAALRAFDVIQGQAAPRAITLRAIVQSYGHEIVLVESTATRCRMKGKRRGSDEWQSVVWTLDRARDLGLLGKDGWKRMPTAMLLARATSELSRLIAADAILGIGYSAEEVTDGGTLDAPTRAETREIGSTGRRTMSRQTTSPPQDDATVNTDMDQDGQDDPGPETGEAPTESARRAMFATFADVGMSDARTTEGREERLRYCSDVIGRTVTTSNDLTATEVTQIIDALKTEAASMVAPAEVDPFFADQEST